MELKAATDKVRISQTRRASLACVGTVTLVTFELGQAPLTHYHIPTRYFMQHNFL